MVKGRVDGQRMVVISLDAVGARDLAFLCTLPNFKRLRERAAYCNHVNSVYPSVTYPAHTSIVTGQMPRKHGVINNIRIQPDRAGKEDWLWQRKFVKTQTLYDLARKKGYQTASLLWPVTAASKIKYCVPEIFPNRSWQNQIMVSALNGPLRYQMEILSHFGHLLDGIKQPQLDNFVVNAAEYTIYKYNPDLFLIHFTDVDTHRHNYGVDAPEVTEALRRHDDRLGRILKALEDTGDMDKTTVVVLGDHCQIDTHTIVYPNYYLKQAGFLKTDKNGKVLSYDFYAQHADGCCYIYPGKEMKKLLKTAAENERREIMTRLSACLNSIPKEMISKIISRRTAKELGADGECVCMLEAQSGYYFQNAWEKPYEKVEDAKEHAMRGVHGYLPQLSGYETFFMMSGYGVAERAEVKEMNLWDEAVVLAEILGVKFKKTDGILAEEMIKSSLK